MKTKRAVEGTSAGWLPSSRLEPSEVESGLWNAQRSLWTLEVLDLCCPLALGDTDLMLKEAGWDPAHLLGCVLVDSSCPVSSTSSAVGPRLPARDLTRFPRTHTLPARS